MRRVERITTWVVAAVTLVIVVSLVLGARGASADAVAGAEEPTPTVPTPDLPYNPAYPDHIGPANPNTSSSSGTPSTRGTDGSVGSADADEDDADASIDLQFPNVQKDSSNSVVIILLLTVLSVAPSLLVLCTSFTRIVIVLGLTRNALGIPSIPPQQVIVGLSIFLTLFVMGPTLSEMKNVALDPLLDGKISTSEALDRAQVPLNALVPAFVLSELKSAFIMGFVIFVPFLVIDLVVSAVLMGLGMMMLPPSFVSLPFKLLLFIMLDGWMLVTSMLLTSYR